MSQKPYSLRTNVTVNIPNITETNCQHTKVIFFVFSPFTRNFNCTHTHTHTQSAREQTKTTNSFFRGNVENNNNNKNYEPKIAQELVGVLCLENAHQIQTICTAQYKLENNIEQRSDISFQCFMCAYEIVFDNIKKKTKTKQNETITTNDSNTIKIVC